MAKPCLLRLHFATFCGDYKRFVVAKVGIFWGSTKPTTTFPTRFTLILYYHLRCACKRVYSQQSTTLLCSGKLFATTINSFLCSGKLFAATINSFLCSGKHLAATINSFLCSGKPLATTINSFCAAANYSPRL